MYNEQQQIAVRGKHPQLASDVFLAPGARVVGDVEIQEASSVWFNALIRGDVNRIRIGREVNIQDGAILHCTYRESETHIGHRVSIGHGAIVHGCRLHDYVLVGMGAKLLDHVEAEPWVLVAAGAVVTPGTRLETGHLYAGVPAKKIRPLTDEERKTIRRTPEKYQQYAGWYTNR